MPNWCDNTLQISNQDKTKIDGLVAELSKKSEDGQSQAELFQYLLPNPSGEWGYDWSCENWGTKWDASIIDWDRYDDNTVWISFETAWAPPIALYDFLVDEGWDVEAYYNEPGCAFCGKYTTQGGDDYYDYDFSDRSTLEDIPSDIDEFTGLLDYHDECKANGDFDEEEVD